MLALIRGPVQHRIRLKTTYWTKVDLIRRSNDIRPKSNRTKHFSFQIIRHYTVIKKSNER